MMRFVYLFFCVAGLVALAMCANAALPQAPLIVTATMGDKVATWEHVWSDTESVFRLTAPVELRAADSTLLGTITSLYCTAGIDPFVTLDFSLHANSTADFTFDSAAVLFPTIDSAIGFATAASTLTSDGNGATLTGNFAGGTAYQAVYNGGSVFASLDSSYVAPPNDSAVETDRLPGSGFTGIAGPVSSIESHWAFNLTGGDDASGTSRFQVEPVPDASTLVLALIGVGPLFVGLRRRRA